MHARHRSRFVLGLLLGLVACTARAIPLEEIPTPRPNGWAVDLTNTLPSERLAELNQLGDQIKEKTGAEMAVVVVSSTNGVDAHEFATRLFNTWGIGERGKENGLLVFAALADHKAEIVLGRGLDGEAGRRESEAVMQGEMVPRFRAGNPAGAIVLGAIACARRILHVSPIHSGVDGLGMVPEAAPETAPETTSYAPSETPAPVVPYSPQPEPAPDPYAQTAYQARAYHAETRGGVVGFLVFGVLVLLIVGGIAVRGYSQGETVNTWTTNSYEDRDRYDRYRERLEEERTTTSSSAAASLGAFSSGRSSSSSSSSDSSSGSSSSSGSNSGFSGGSSSGGGASGSW
jgi:uncharacterized membrane protein YgcG